MKTTIIFVLIALCGLSQGNKLAVQTEKAGQCPNNDGVVGICSIDPKESCAGDSDCLGPLKCCARPCGGKTCVDAIQVSPPLSPRENPGQCPPRTGSRGICSFDPKSNCLGDQECSPNQKCCADQCGKTCKYSIQISPPRPGPPPPPVPPRASLQRPGQCPAPSGSLGICTFDPKKNCLGDQECGPAQKCCSDQCGKTCKNVVQSDPPAQFRVPPPPRSLERPGQCPVPSAAFGVCSFDPKNNCLADQDCAPNQKCCSDQCGKTCKSSIQVSPPKQSQEHPGQCPAPSGSFGVCTFDPKNNCLGDQDCSANQKCCSDQCGKTCKHSLQISPPGPGPQRPPPPPPARQGLQKPGQCPASGDSFKACVFDPTKNCLSDQECSDDLKCCSDGCGKICKRPIRN